MIPIEILSYFIRPLSLSVRLFANMVAGHVMLDGVGGFVSRSASGRLDPARLRDVLFALELLIACLQAYVFTILHLHLSPRRDPPALKRAGSRGTIERNPQA
jgi:F-type H+-transporting ATPase subunit a